MRLLWLIDSLTAGGAEALTLGFARGLAGRSGRNGPPGESGTALTVACLKSLGGNPYEQAVREAGVPVVHLGAQNLRDLRAFRRLLALLDEQRIELLHAHLESATIWGALAGHRAGVPVVTTFHVAPPPEPGWTRAGLRRRLRIAAVNRWPRANLAVSGAVRRAWLERGVAPGRVTVVTNGIDPVPFARAAADRALRRHLRTALGVPAGAPLVLAVSVLREGKGMEVLVEAARRVAQAAPETRFAVAGDGPLRGALEARSAAAGLGDRLRWLGFRRDVASLLAAADVFVQPSLDDALPTALLEAMAAGLSPVATDAGGIPEVVEQGSTGLLVPAGDADSLARALIRLASRPEERATLGGRAQRRVEERFSIGAWLGRLEAVYGGVLGRRVELGSVGAPEPTVTGSRPAPARMGEGP